MFVVHVTTAMLMTRCALCGAKVTSTSGGAYGHQRVALQAVYPGMITTGDWKANLMGGESGWPKRPRVVTIATLSREVCGAMIDRDRRCVIVLSLMATKAR